MTNTLHLISLLIFSQIVEDLACRFGRTDYDVNDAYIKKWSEYGQNKKDKIPLEHWTIPIEIQAQYGKWINEYLDNRTKLKQDEKYGQPPKGMSIPNTWKGYGGGHGGQDAPPWAIVDGYDKPIYCFMDPDIGFCEGAHPMSVTVTRWGYNSFEKNCDTFQYAGCNGNANNFLTEARCNEQCTDKIKSNCGKYGEYIEY